MACCSRRGIQHLKFNHDIYEFWVIGFDLVTAECEMKLALLGLVLGVRVAAFRRVVTRRGDSTFPWPAVRPDIFAQLVFHVYVKLPGVMSGVRSAAEVDSSYWVELLLSVCMYCTYKYNTSKCSSRRIIIVFFDVMSGADIITEFRPLRNTICVARYQPSMYIHLVDQNFWSPTRSNSYYPVQPEKPDCCSTRHGCFYHRAVFFFLSW